MLILILINVLYLKNVVFSFEKGSIGHSHSLLHSNLPIEKSPRANFPSPLPITTIWKTQDKGPGFLKFVSLFQVKFNFSSDNTLSALKRYETHVLHFIII